MLRQLCVRQLLHEKHSESCSLTDHGLHALRLLDLKEAVRGCLARPLERLLSKQVGQVGNSARSVIWRAMQADACPEAYPQEHMRMLVSDIQVTQNADVIPAM